MNNNCLFKYGNDVIWSLPCLFQYEIVFGAIQSTLNAFGFEALNANVFGSPATIWSSGRAAVVMDTIDIMQLRKVFNYVQRNNGGTPTFTFSRIDITKDDLKSDYENYLLDFAIEHEARFIVSSDLLRDYIKNKNPNSVVVASILKPIYRFQGKDKLEEPTIDAETNYYNKLLRDYDVVVVRPEYSKTVLINHPELIDDIARIEVLINQICISNCENAKLHSSLLQKSHIESVSFKQMYCPKTLYSPIQKYTNNSAHTSEEIETLIKHGVKHLKLQGRGEEVSYLLNTFLLTSQMFNFDGPNNVFLIMLLNESLKNEYNKFKAIVDKDGLWDFPTASSGLL